MLKVNDKVAGSGSASVPVSISQTHGSADPDPHQKWHGSATLVLTKALLCSIGGDAVDGDWLRKVPGNTLPILEPGLPQRGRETGKQGLRQLRVRLESWRDVVGVQVHHCGDVVVGVIQRGDGMVVDPLVDVSFE